jgi:hypothetical protein
VPHICLPSADVGFKDNELMLSGSNC